MKIKKQFPVLKILYVIAFSYFFVGCFNKTKIEVDSNVANNLELMNSEFYKVLNWYEKKSIFKGLPDKIDINKVQRIYANSKEIIKQNDNPKDARDSIKSNNFKLSKYLNETLGENARWEGVRKKVKIVKKEIDNLLESYANNPNIDSFKLKKEILINTEIMFNLIFQIIYSHKFEYELNFGSHDAYVIKNENMESGMAKLEIGVFNKESDTYSIELFCNDEKVNIENSKATYIYNRKTMKEDSLKISTKTTHLFNGVQIINTNKYKVK